MSAATNIQWTRILVAGVLAETAIFAMFFLLLLGATLAGVPEMARPGSTLDFVDAIVASFAMPLLLTLWAGKRIESQLALHGALIGLVGVVLFLVVILAATRSLEQPPLYLVAHGLKVLGGVVGGLVAERRKAALVTVQ